MNNKLEIMKLTMTYCPETKLYWTDTMNGTFTHQQALDYAQSLDMRLPTKEEFKLAYKNGLKFDEGWFWSSSLHPQNADYAFYFSGRNGYVNGDLRDNQSGVRCVLENI